MVERIAQHLHAVKHLELIMKLQNEHDNLTEWLHSEAIKPYSMRFLFQTEQSTVNKLERLNKRIARWKQSYSELLIQIMLQDGN